MPSWLCKCLRGCPGTLRYLFWQCLKKRSWKTGSQQWYMSQEGPDTCTEYRGSQGPQYSHKAHPRPLARPQSKASKLNHGRSPCPSCSGLHLLSLQNNWVDRVDWCKKKSGTGLLFPCSCFPPREGTRSFQRTYSVRQARWNESGEGVECIHHSS